MSLTLRGPKYQETAALCFPETAAYCHFSREPVTVEKRVIRINKTLGKDEKVINTDAIKTVNSAGSAPLRIIDGDEYYMMTFVTVYTSLNNEVSITYDGSNYLAV